MGYHCVDMLSKTSVVEDFETSTIRWCVNCVDINPCLGLEKNILQSVWNSAWHDELV